MPRSRTLPIPLPALLTLSEWGLAVIAALRAGRALHNRRCAVWIGGSSGVLEQSQLMRLSGFHRLESRRIACITAYPRCGVCTGCITAIPASM